MTRIETYEKITSHGLIGVVRAKGFDDAHAIITALIEGGCEIIELTFTIPEAHKVLSKLANLYQHENKVVFGAGTILDSETARIAILEGAQFLVSPHCSTEVVQMGNRYKIATMPGVSNVSEVVKGHEMGAEILKFFPGENMGPKFITSIRGPIPYASLLPTGGVSLSNIADWIRAGAVALGVGGPITKLAPGEDFSAITNRTKEFLAEIRKARSEA